MNNLTPITNSNTIDLQTTTLNTSLVVNATQSTSLDNRSGCNSDNDIVTLWLAKKTTLTRSRYKSTINRFFNFINKPINNIKDIDLELFKSSLINLKTGLPLADNTIKTMLATLRSFFSFCEKTGYTKYNLGVMLTSPKINTKRAATYIKQDVLIDKINSLKNNNYRDYLIVLLAYSLGLRVNELLNLKYSNFTVFSDNITLYIKGKGNKERNIAIPNDIYDEIINFKSNFDNDDSFIFKGYQGCQLSYSRCNSVIKKVLGTDHHAHELRHNHAFHSLENGCTLNDLRKSLGHANLNTTQIYLDAMPTISSSNFIKFPTNKKAS